MFKLLKVTFIKFVIFLSKKLCFLQIIFLLFTVYTNLKGNLSL